MGHGLIRFNFPEPDYGQANTSSDYSFLGSPSYISTMKPNKIFLYYYWDIGKSNQSSYKNWTKQEIHNTETSTYY